MGTCERDLTWKSSHCRYNQIEMRTRDGSLKRDIWIQTQKRSHENRQILERCGLKPRTCMDCQQNRSSERCGCFLPQSLLKAQTLPKPWLRTSGLHNHEDKFLLFMELSLWYFVMTVSLETTIVGLKKKSRREKEGGHWANRVTLGCCTPWGCKESDTTERLNNSSTSS